MKRRDFLKRTAARFASWTPFLGLLGFQFNRYSNPSCLRFWRGSIDWCGRCVGFVRSDGSILWMW